MPSILEFKQNPHRASEPAISVDLALLARPADHYYTSSLIRCACIANLQSISFRPDPIAFLCDLERGEVSPRHLPLLQSIRMRVRLRRTPFPDPRELVGPPLEGVYDVLFISEFLDARRQRCQCSPFLVQAET